MLPAVIVANAREFAVPEATVARLERHLLLAAVAQRRIDPDLFIASHGFHRGELDGLSFVYEMEPTQVTAYVTSAPR